MIATAILAAGSARRMRGGDKLLEPVQGAPVLRHLTVAALAAGGPVAATLRSPDPARAAVLGGIPVTQLAVPDAAEGMAASIRAAAAWAQEIGAAGLILCPGDLPELETADFATIASALTSEGPPIRACDKAGRPGHPVAFPARLLPELGRLQGDAGARAVLATHPPRLIPLPGHRATRDLDTPEAWAAWRAGSPPEG